MDPKNYHAILDELTEWVIDTEQVKSSQGKLKNGISLHTPPERGYTVVLSSKTQTTTCGWCQEQVETPNLKTYSRAIDGSAWEARCKTCKQKKIIPMKGFEK